MCKFKDFIPVNGEIARATYPQENFDFSEIDISDLVKAWNIRTPTEPRSREQMFSKHERSLPIRWFNV